MSRLVDIVDCLQTEMPNFLKPFKTKGSSNGNSDGANLTNRPFYLSPEHLSSHVNSSADPNYSHTHLHNANCPSGMSELPLMEQYSDPKDLIDTFKNSLEIEAYNPEEQNYMVPFQEAPETNQTTTVLHNQQRDSLSDKLENNFTGEVYENIPSESPQHRPQQREGAMDSRRPAEQSGHGGDDSYYETTWGMFGEEAPPDGNDRNNADRYQNYSSQLSNGAAAGHASMYENANLFPSPERSVQVRYANDVFTNSEDTLSGSQIPMNDSRPDAEYDVPWTCAAAAAAAAASSSASQVSQSPSQSAPKGRPPLKSSNSTDEFTPQPAPRGRHKSGDFGNKNLFAQQKSVSNHAKTQPPVAAPELQTRTVDFRPEDDYDQPWELTAAKRSSVAFRGNENNLSVAHPESNKATGQFTDPTDDMRPEDDYDQPWNLTNKQSSKMQSTADVESSFGASQKSVAPPLNTSASVVEDRPNSGASSVTASSHALQRGHHRSSAKTKKSATPSTSSTSGSPSAASPELVDAGLSLEEQTWYHGQISRIAAEARLRPAPECSFLVRRSESSRHDYSLSIKSASTIMHMKIQYQESTRKYILGQFSKPYKSIPAMIAYYSKHTLNIKGAENVVLMHPVSDTADNML